MLPFAANGPSTRLTWWLVKTQCLRILSLTQIHVISCSWVSKMQTDKNTIDTIVSCSFSLNATAAPSATALAAWQLLGSTASSWCFYKSKKTCVVSYVPIWIHLARFLSLRCSDLHFPGLETTYRHYDVLRIFLPVSDLILTCLTCVWPVTLMAKVNARPMDIGTSNSRTSIQPSSIPKRL